MSEIIITVTGVDKVGIVASISNYLKDNSVNIEDIKQSIMQDNFVMIMLCSIEGLQVPFKEFKEKLVELGQNLGMEIWIQKKDIFDKMHTI